jgi:outer membrane protein
VKKLIICLATVALGVGLLIGARASLGEDAKKTAAAAEMPHKVGLIDMAHVFKEYGKFKALSDALKKEVEATDNEAKGKVELLQKLQAQLTSGQIAEGSADYSALEEQLVAKSTELEAFRKMKQREFLRKEADIYKTVYLEVQDAVQQYAEYFDYTLIMRFSRDKVEGAENPQEIIQSMNRPVVYHRNQFDVTDPILKYLNETYTKSAARPAAPAGGQRTR